MRDTTNHRKALEAARAELIASWSGKFHFDADRAGRATESLRATLRNMMPITIPVPEEINHPPTADQVAVAIVAACKETGADPVAVATGESGIGAGRDASQTYSVSRARAYAALALRTIFIENSATSISRMVGSQSPEVHLATIDARIRNGDLKWFDNDAFMRVVAATEESV